MTVKELINELSRYDSEQNVRLSIVQTENGLRYSTNADAVGVECVGQTCSVFIRAELNQD